MLDDVMVIVWGGRAIKDQDLICLCISGPARVELPGAVLEDEISDRDSPDACSLSSTSPPQVVEL